MPQRLVSIDPGGTTGYAILEQAEDDLWDVVEVKQKITDEDLEHIIKPGDIVIYENIQVFDRSIRTIGIEVIGALKIICRLVGITPIKRTPGYLQGIRHWPLALPVKCSRHAKDALHHAVVYLGYKNIRGCEMYGPSHEAYSQPRK